MTEFDNGEWAMVNRSARGLTIDDRQSRQHFFQISYLSQMINIVLYQAI